MDNYFINSANISVFMQPKNTLVSSGPYLRLLLSFNLISNGSYFSQQYFKHLKGTLLQGKTVKTSKTSKRYHLLFRFLKKKAIVLIWEELVSQLQVNLTSACFSISCKSLFAGTSVRSNGIFALGINVTGISARRTFVDISLLHRLLLKHSKVVKYDVIIF